MEQKCLNIEKNDEILVSIAIVTNNHEKFISQTIESILNQKTNFKIEIVICRIKKNIVKSFINIIKHKKIYE